MESRECPNCGILNPAANERCDDCGSSFDAVFVAVSTRNARRVSSRLESQRQSIRIVVLSVFGLFGCLGMAGTFLLAIVGFQVLATPLPLIPKTVVHEKSDIASSYAISSDLLGRARLGIDFVADDSSRVSCTTRLNLYRVNSHQWLRGGKVAFVDLVGYPHDFLAYPHDVRGVYDFVQRRLYFEQWSGIACTGLPGEAQELNRRQMDVLVTSYE